MFYILRTVGCGTDASASGLQRNGFSRFLLEGAQASTEHSVTTINLVGPDTLTGQIWRQYGMGAGSGALCQLWL
ncbi:hypothetical protein [Gluconobacter frateurii]|uniref:hypothetical protein n=1 Tax=Gluconobacter frateurii TaxID=38308 RepID=UPI001C3FCA0E|nr:hypothetical protein [Gluconobacter frateurii]GLP90926.1 hypothetical protein GCM10007868_20010 [Gluconobacter frateurii]